jgi:hypothetical protein
VALNYGLTISNIILHESSSAGGGVRMVGCEWGHEQTDYVKPSAHATCQGVEAGVQAHRAWDQVLSDVLDKRGAFAWS